MVKRRQDGGCIGIAAPPSLSYSRSGPRNLLWISRPGPLVEGQSDPWVRETLSKRTLGRRL